jgi:hypothetical protein
MTAATINKINSAIAKHGVEVVKGEGYFYFAALPGAPMGVEDCIDSVYSNVLRCMSLENWIEHAENGVAKFKEGN